MRQFLEPHITKTCSLSHSSDGNECLDQPPVLLLVVTGMAGLYIPTHISGKSIGEVLPLNNICYISGNVRWKLLMTKDLTEKLPWKARCHGGCLGNQAQLMPGSWITPDPHEYLHKLSLWVTERSLSEAIPVGLPAAGVTGS